MQKQNSWRRTPTCYNTPQLVPAIDRRRPGPGYRHLLLKRDIERFVDLLPNWDDLCVGLDVIVLDHGREDRDGWYDRGVLGICAWSIDMDCLAGLEWYLQHAQLLTRFGVPVEPAENNEFLCHWTPSTARAYQLLHVFLHELGHHIDRMSARLQKSSELSEGFAEEYAWMQELVLWDSYCDEFGMPG